MPPVGACRVDTYNASMADFYADTARKSAFFLKNLAVSVLKTPSGAFWLSTRQQDLSGEWFSGRLGIDIGKDDLSKNY